MSKLIPKSGQSYDEILRDLRIMAARGKSFDYIKSVFNWSTDQLTQFCRLNNIAVTGMPPRSPSVVDANPAAQAYRIKRPYHRAPIDKVRHVQLGMQTTAEIDLALQIEGAKRGHAKSRIVHNLLVAIHARNLWAELLDSDSQSVASASPQETSQRK